MVFRLREALTFLPTVVHWGLLQFLAETMFGSIGGPPRAFSALRVRRKRCRMLSQ